LYVGRPLLPGIYLILISVISCVDTRVIVRLEGLIRSIEKKIHVIGTRTRDLPACGIMPQPTTLPRVPKLHLSKAQNEDTVVQLILYC
jgi:hypothetical protein